MIFLITCVIGIFSVYYIPLWFQCINPKKQAKKKSYKNSGTVSHFFHEQYFYSHVMNNHSEIILGMGPAIWRRCYFVTFLSPYPECLMLVHITLSVLRYKASPCVMVQRDFTPLFIPWTCIDLHISYTDALIFRGPLAGDFDELSHWAAAFLPWLHPWRVSSVEG